MPIRMQGLLGVLPWRDILSVLIISVLGVVFMGLATQSRAQVTPKTPQTCSSGLGAVYSTWSVPSSSSGRGVFTSGTHSPAIPDYTWTITGDLSANSVDSSETFNGANSFETIYGQADTQSNLNPRVQGNNHTTGSPIAKSLTIAMTFDAPTPAKGLGFAIIDIDSEQVQITAKDASGNAVPASVVASWFVQVFDPNPGSGGTTVPAWQPSYPALIGPLTGQTVWQDNSRGNLGDDEAPGGWFQPDIPLSQISLTMEPVDSTSTTHSVHIYMASCLEQRDYSDAPLTGTNYGAASHVVVPGYRLGAGITAENGAYDSATASADSDDGISIPALTQSLSTTITASVAGTGGYLQGWIDWNNDGDWNDAGERIATNLQDANSSGTISVPVTPPATAALSPTIARFRWSSVQNLGANENTADGEVEDYPLSVQPSGGGGLSCPIGMAPAIGSGNASTVIVNSKDGDRALGAIAGAGTEAKNVSAKVESGNPTLILRLASIVPGNALVTFSLSREDNSGNIVIASSLNSSTGFAQIGSFSGGSTGDLSHVTFYAPPGGMEYVRFSFVGGKSWIDGVRFSNICVNSPGKLNVSKSMTVWDPANEGRYSVPGVDVLYSISVSNVGGGNVDFGSTEIIDALPPQIEFWNGDVDAGGANTFPGTDPVGFVQSTGTGLTFTYASDVRFGTGTSPPANFAACTTLSPDNSYRSDIKYICFNPKGTMASGNPNPNFSVNFRTRIK